MPVFPKFLRASFPYYLVSEPIKKQEDEMDFFADMEPVIKSSHRSVLDVKPLMDDEDDDPKDGDKPKASSKSSKFAAVENDDAEGGAGWGDDVWGDVDL